MYWGNEDKKLFNSVLREQKEKTKTCALAPYQDLLIFFFIKRHKKSRDKNQQDIFWPSTKPLNMANLFFKKESICLMHRFSLLLFSLSLFFFHQPLPSTTQLINFLSSVPQYLYYCRYTYYKFSRVLKHMVAVITLYLKLKED